MDAEDGSIARIGLCTIHQNKREVSETLMKRQEKVKLSSFLRRILSNFPFNSIFVAAFLLIVLYETLFSSFLISLPIVQTCEHVMFSMDQNLEPWFIKPVLLMVSNFYYDHKYQ